MSDRSRRIVWIAIAVCGFAVVVVAAALLLFPPVANADLKPFDITGRSPAKPQEPTDYVALPTIVVEPSDSGTQGGSQSSSSGSDTRIVIVSPASGSNTSQSTGGTASGSTGPAGAAPASSVPTQPGTTPASTETKPVAKPVAPAAPAPAPVTPAVKQPAPPGPTPAAQTTPPAPSKTEPAVKVSPPAPEAASQSSNYWIQVGSFSTKTTAEKLRDEFTARNLSAIITIKDISGKSYYQVKVGPYPSAEEAKKWLLTAKSVPGASQEAFVTNK